MSTIIPPLPKRLFPPPEGGTILRNKGRHPARILTAGGELEVTRRYFWAAGQEGVYPTDSAAGIADSRVTPGAREICCRMGMVQDFAQASEDTKRIAGLPICKERLRQVVEAEATVITEIRHKSQLPASWTVPQTAPTAQGTRRGYAGVDGVMAPMVTQAEKDKRRAEHVTRRKQRAAQGRLNLKPLPAARPGSDQSYKEMKIGVFYDQDKKHRHAFATEKTHEAFGPLLKVYAMQVLLHQADEALSLTDGARWIATKVNVALAFLMAMLLDFFHLSEHVFATARDCLGDTPQAREWAEARLNEFKTLGVMPVLAAIEAMSKACRAAAKRDSLRRLRQYIVERNDMMDYRTALARGWDIGSGPTEAMCKNLTLRLKRPGMKWDAKNAAGMMNLTALYESRQAKTYWDRCRAA